MSREAVLLLLAPESTVAAPVREALERLGTVRWIPDGTALDSDMVSDVTLALVHEDSLATWAREESGIPLLLLLNRDRSTATVDRRFDDVAPVDDAGEVGRRAEILLTIREAADRARQLGITAEELRGELARYGLDPGLAGTFGLLPPRRVAVESLVDVDAVNRQQMSICRLMGTAYGTFLSADRPRGLVRSDGEEITPTGALSPYCAYLSAQGGRCLKGEYAAAIQAVERGRPVETKCEGRVAIYSVPFSLSFQGATYPLFAASVAIGGVPEASVVPEVSRNYRVNAEILGQMAQESRHWVLHPDKADELRITFQNLAETISREVSHKYGTAWQLLRSLVTEAEIRHSRGMLAESNLALEQTNRQLLAKNEEIYEVTHAITHDLRKPLVSMKATLGVVRQGRLGEVPERQVLAIETAWEATGYMNQLVDDLLEAARLEAGRKLLEIQDVEVEPILRKTVKRLAPLLEETGVELTIEDLPRRVRADPIGLEKILMNLVGNSISYIGEGEKRILVRGRERDDIAEISVMDTGIGIPAASLPEVCEKFRRGANVSGIRGTGLGLSIVRGMVDALGGDLRIESTLGEGTCVTFTLPVVHAETLEDLPHPA